MYLIVIWTMAIAMIISVMIWMGSDTEMGHNDEDDFNRLSTTLQVREAKMKLEKQKAETIVKLQEVV